MRSRRRRQLRKKITRVFLFFCTSTALFYTVLVLLFVRSTKVEAEVISPLAQDAPSILKAETQAVLPSSEALKAIVDEALNKSTAKYGIVIKNLRTGESYGLNEHQKFETASLYKLWVMGTVYQKMKEGTVKETDPLGQDVQILNKKFSIASEAAELKEGRVSGTVDSALIKMITVSDNYSALLLTERVKLASVTAFLKDNGLTESKVGNASSGPISTPSDVALVLEKIYKGQIVDQTYSEKMMTLLKSQRLNKKLPKYLPAGTVFAHKTGELGAYSHDAGIVFTENGDYLIVVMSQSNSQLGANERMAEISKNVYTHFASASAN